MVWQRGKDGRSLVLGTRVFPQQLCSGQPPNRPLPVFLCVFFNGSIVDLQCCDSFRCVAKWLYICVCVCVCVCVYSFSDSFILYIIIRY